MKTINLQDTNIKNIGEYAFYGCELLQEVILPSTLKKIEQFAFYECKGITKIEFEYNS